jgi:hypothetical protein
LYFLVTQCTPWGWVRVRLVSRILACPLLGVRDVLLGFYRAAKTDGAVLVKRGA